jgi:preprotein translocase subunit SecB
MQDSQSPETPEEAAASEVPAQRIEIQKVYVKDISYEAPGTPQIFTEKWVPEINQEMRNSHTQLSEQVYESRLTITVTVKVAGKVAYLIEVNQAGIFSLFGYSPEVKANILAVYCPSILFPYIREAASSLSVRGGFPQLVLPHVSFEDLHKAYLKQKKQAVGDDSGTTATH